MSETKDKEAGKSEASGSKLTLGSGKGTLSLKGGSGAAMRAAMPSGGFSVEVRRKRTAAPGAGGAASGQAVKNDDLHLTSGEREARARALREALAGDSKPKMPPVKRRTIEDIKREEAETEKATGLTARERELEEMRAIELQEQKARGGVVRDTPGGARPLPSGGFRPAGPEEEELSYRDRMKKGAAKPATKTTEEPRGRITVTQALNEDYERDRGRSLAAQKRARAKAKLAALGPKEAPKKVFREITLPETITVQELANRMAEGGSDVVKSLMKMGVMATITQTIDADTAELIATEFGHKVKRVTEGDIEIGVSGDHDSDADLLPRPPVVTVMGHVDHGKTSLLDALRQTDVVSGEAGGITQHIGAYQVTMPSGAKITFLDTPGHAAFTEMRARGANVTDIVVVVVSAEDSIMPQSIEAINHARAAKVPIIIAINKIDLPNAKPDKVKQDLLQHEVVIEEMGGDVLCIEVSAKKKINLDRLEEMILLQAEVLELKANPKREAQGAIVEAKQEKGRGTVVTALIQKGTLKVGDIFVAGAEFGKVRALINDRGQPIQAAIPGQPVEVLGLNGTPDAGDMLSAVADEGKAREISDYRQRKRREAQAAKAVKGRTTMEQLVAQKSAGETTTLPVIIKGDVHGSVEAIISSLEKMAGDNEGVAVQVLHSGVGGITESDVTLARASGALIIGFNVRANAQARDLAQRDGINIRYYNIIYNVIDDVKAVLTGMLSPTEREEYLGQAAIREVFNITKVGKVAGCMVTVGIVKRGAKVRLLRDSVVIHEGKLKTLKRFKDEVKEVKEGTECGMAFENYDDIKAGDVIECFEVIEEARTVT